MKKKLVVWYVDDLPENLERFKNNHQQVFEMRTFSTPEQVMSALVDSKPEALLCDVFFYGSVAIAEDMEKRVQEKAAEIRKFGEDIEANMIANQAGVPLIQSVSAENAFRFTPIPPKGPIFSMGLDLIGLVMLVRSGCSRVSTEQRRNKLSSSRTSKIIISRTRSPSVWLAIFGRQLLEAGF